MKGIAHYGPVQNFFTFMTQKPLKECKHYGIPEHTTHCVQHLC